jgi:hypothetical protein
LFICFSIDKSEKEGIFLVQFFDKQPHFMLFSSAIFVHLNSDIQYENVISVSCSMVVRATISGKISLLVLGKQFESQE